MTRDKFGIMHIQIISDNCYYYCNLYCNFPRILDFHSSNSDLGLGDLQFSSAIPSETLFHGPHCDVNELSHPKLISPAVQILSEMEIIEYLDGRQCNFTVLIIKV